MIISIIVATIWDIFWTKYGIRPCRNYWIMYGIGGGTKAKGSLFENRILRWIFGPKNNENAEWGRLHNEELHSLYHSPNIVRVNKSRRLRLSGHVARMGEFRSSLKILTGKPTGKIPLGMSRRRWEDNIRMDLKK